MPRTLGYAMLMATWCVTWLAVTPAAAMAEPRYCADEVSRTSAAQVFAARQTVRREIVEALSEDARLRICAAWSTVQAPRRAGAPVVSDTPALILAGEYDPLTPPSYAEVMSRTLRNGRWFEFPATGHAVERASSCAHAMMIDFLAAPHVAPDAHCIADMPPPTWVIPGS